VNLRIGGRDDSLLKPVRDGQAVARRGATPVSAPGGRRGADDAGPDVGGGGVVVKLSPEARKALGEDPGGGAEDRDGAARAAGPKPLTPDDERVVRQLEARDTQVRAHEAAHQAAARGLGGAASFTYSTGPDGRRYAVGGEVPVQLKSGRTPDETISNAQAVRSAALAPADPSGQDMAVASEAAQMEAEARQQKSQDQADAVKQSVDGGDRDPLKVFSALKAERKADPGRAAGHTRAGDGCGFCQGAAARYA
jgi:hypothetical protein